LTDVAGELPAEVVGARVLPGDRVVHRLRRVATPQDGVLAPVGIRSRRRVRPESRRRIAAARSIDWMCPA
jgi:hypothetical protein